MEPKDPVTPRDPQVPNWRLGGSPRPMEPRDPHLGDPQAPIGGQGSNLGNPGYPPREPRYPLEARDPTIYHFTYINSDVFRFE